SAVVVAVSCEVCGRGLSTSALDPWPLDFGPWTLNFRAAGIGQTTAATTDKQARVFGGIHERSLGLPQIRAALERRCPHSEKRAQRGFASNPSLRPQIREETE